MARSVCSLCGLLILVFSCVSSPDMQSSSVTAESTPLRPLLLKSTDIPRYENTGDYYFYYVLTKQKEKQLGLVKPEQYTGDLIFRIWATIPISYKKYLGFPGDHAMADDANQYGYMIEFRREGSSYVGRIVFFIVRFEQVQRRESIVVSDLKMLTPRTSWKNIESKLAEYDVFSLPTDELLSEYDLRTGGYNVPGNTYCIEISDRTNYKFIQYHNVFSNKDKYPEMARVSDLLTYFANEFRDDDFQRAFIKNQVENLNLR